MNGLKLMKDSDISKLVDDVFTNEEPLKRLLKYEVLKLFNEQQLVFPAGIVNSKGDRRYAGYIVVENFLGTGFSSVRSIYIDPPCRRMGIGKALVLHFLRDVAPIHLLEIDDNDQRATSFWNSIFSLVKLYDVQDGYSLYKVERCKFKYSDAANCVKTRMICDEYEMLRRIFFRTKQIETDSKRELSLLSQEEVSNLLLGV